MTRTLLVWYFGLLLCDLLHAPAAVHGDEQRPARVTSGLQAFYDLATVEENRIVDRAQAGKPLNLVIGDLRGISPSTEGLQISGKAVIRSEQAPHRLTQSISRSGEISIEAWIQPANLKQDGPARIVTFSGDTTNRNFTLGQDGTRLEVRLRTDKTNANGIPALRTQENSLKSELTHVAYTRNRRGQATLYLNGKLAAQDTIPGALSNWNGSYQLALANELSGDRPWSGTIRLVAIYNRALTPQEVQQNFRAGPHGQSSAARQAVKNDNARLFETKVAPLLARHCLECHDAPTREGGLDLSRRAMALAGGESGPAIVPGQAAESLLWQHVESDEMPRKRPPLSAEEKGILRTWLDQGADWTLDFVDPAVYVHAGSPQKVFVQRLTVSEYIATVRSTTGVDIAAQARELLPRDQRADGFSNTAYNLNVDLAHVEAYSKLAEIVVSRMDIPALCKKYTKSRELTDENVTKVVVPYGRLLLRGPLSNEEIARYCGISTTVAAAGGNFEEAIAFVLEAMLQSPRFLYRIENHQGGGGRVPADSYELASRLSYILWGGPPDEQLLQAAEKNQLDREGVAAQARRMLNDPRAVERSRLFISEWLNLRRLDSLRPNPERFPHWDPQLADDMREETLAFFEEVVWKQNRPLSELLNAQFTFVTPQLAKHYGLPAGKNAKGDQPLRYDLSSVPGRGGLLTHGSILTVGGDDASTVARGLFLMHELMRGVVRDPPPCVDTTPVPTKPGLSRRAVAEMRLANQSCAGCHGKFEPLAFGLMKFDGLGTYQDTDEHGNTLRDDGSILFPGQEKPVTFHSAAELMELLAHSERVKESIAWKVTQFALGRPLAAEDAPLVAEIHRTSQEQGGTYPALMTAIVLSDLVLTTRTEPPETDSQPQ